MNLSADFLGGAEAQQAYAQARAATVIALTLNPDLASAHDARGYLLVMADFDWTGAEAEYRSALQLAPGDGSAKLNLSTLLATQGRPQQAVELAQQALASNPLYASGYALQASYLAGLGLLDDAERGAREAVSLQPDAGWSHVVLTIVEILRGNARAALTVALQTLPGPLRADALALARQIGPDHAAADTALKDLIDKYANDSAYQIAEVYALRRDPDKTFEWLDRAWANRDPGIHLLFYDPFILRYKDDPRFAAFCKKIGLPTTTDANAMP